MTALLRRTMLAGALTCMLLPGLASAQAGGATQDNQQTDQTQRQQNQRRFAMLAEKLNLTPDQKKQWLQINRETSQKVRAARKDDSLTEEQMQAQLKDVHKQHNQQILALLTPEQQATLKSFWEEQRKKQQSEASDASSSTTAADNSKDKDEDDLFAGMVPDPDPTPQPAKKKAAAPK